MVRNNQHHVVHLKMLYASFFFALFWPLDKHLYPLAACFGVGGGTKDANAGGGGGYCGRSGGNGGGSGGGGAGKNATGG